MAHIERVFEIPQKTLNRWKSSRQTSATGLAFLRLISTYPWLTEVAELKFDERAAEQILIREGGYAFHRYVSSVNGRAIEITMNGDYGRAVALMGVMPNNVARTEPEHESFSYVASVSNKPVITAVG